MTIPNQAPDSSVAGYLQPQPPPTLDDEALDDFLQQFIAGLAALDGTLVRPRWQPEPPNLPAFGADWIAVGVVGRRADTYAAVQHRAVVPDRFCFTLGRSPLDGANPLCTPLDPAEIGGYDELQRHEVLDVLLTFYGQHAAGLAALVRDNLQIAQNREILLLNEMGLVECGEITAAPEFFRQRWWERSDMHVFIRRRIVRQYLVKNLLEAVGTVAVDAGPTAAFDTARVKA